MNRENIFRLIASHTCEVIPELTNASLKHETSFKELGANSVDRAEIIMMAMESLSLNIPRTELFGAHSIGELVDVLYEKKQSVHCQVSSIKN